MADTANQLHLYMADISNQSHLYRADTANQLHLCKQALVLNHSLSSTRGCMQLLDSAGLLLGQAQMMRAGT